MTFSRPRAVASIFSLGIHAIVLLALFYRFGAYLPIIDLQQIQTVSLILPIPTENRHPPAPVRVAPEKKAINREINQHKEAGATPAPAKELASDKREEEAAPVPVNEKEDKRAPQSMEVQAEDAGVAGISEEEKRVGDMKTPSLLPSGHQEVQAPAVFAPRQEEMPAFPLGSPGPFAGASVKGKTGERDSLGQVTGKGKVMEGETFLPGHTQLNTPAERPSLRGPAASEAAPGGGLVVAAPRYGENSLPAYPLLARRRGYAGIVMLSVEVLTDGTVGHIEVKKTSGYDLLDRSAFEAVKGWKFVPAKKAGLPIIMRVDVPVRFSLN